MHRKRGLAVELEVPELAEVERRSGCLVAEVVLLWSWTMDDADERGEVIEGRSAAGQHDGASSFRPRYKKKESEQSALGHHFTMFVSTEAPESPTSWKTTQMTESTEIGINRRERPHALSQRKRKDMRRKSTFPTR